MASVGGCLGDGVCCSGGDVEDSRDVFEFLVGGIDCSL